MALPWIFQSNFEGGTNGEWDTETDTDGVLDFPHYSDLARLPWSQAAPFRGAFCARIKLNGGTNDATLTEGDIDIADGATASLRFYLQFGADFNATATDVMSLFEFQQAGGTVEATLGLRLTAVAGGLCTIEIGVGDGTAPSDYAAQFLDRNRWYCIEVTMKCHTTDLGTLTLYIDGASMVALTTLDNAAAVGQGVLGAQLHLATTTGTILLDQFSFDDLRIGPIVDRFPEQVLLTKSGHVFVGAGEVANVSLLKTTATDQVLKLWDTDRALTGDESKISVTLFSGGSTVEIIDPAGMPVKVRRGCYIEMTGTAGARAMVNICSAPHYSAANIRRLGLMKGPVPLEI